MIPSPLARRLLVRSALVTAGASALAALSLREARADTAFTAFSFVGTGFPTARTMPSRIGEIVNVRDWGAKGDGNNDDTLPIQAALDYAFGTSASPHGNGGGVNNRPVYFPRGTYKITSPLSVTSVWGGLIYGDGQLCSIISYTGSIATPINADNILPVLWLNGCSYTTIRGLMFQNQTDPTNHYTTCLWWGPTADSNAHGNLIEQCFFYLASNGVVHGGGVSAANSENTYLGCNWQSNEQYGISLAGANTLNYKIIGGGLSDCGVGIRVASGGQVYVANVAFHGNTPDIRISGGAIPVVVDCCRTESGAFVDCFGNSQATLTGCAVSAQGGSYQGYTVGTAFTITAVNDQCNVAAQGHNPYLVGMQIFATDGVHALPIGTGSAPNINTVVTAQVSGGDGAVGAVYALSSAGAGGDVGSVGTPVTFSVRPVFARCDLASLTLEGCSGPGSAWNSPHVGGVVVGAAEGQLWVRNNQLLPTVNVVSTDHLLDGFKGSVRSWDYGSFLPQASLTVANLPAASSIFKGCRMFVVDSNITASGNYAVDISTHGGGANTVTVFCDGSAWRIG